MEKLEKSNQQWNLRYFSWRIFNTINSYIHFLPALPFIGGDYPGCFGREVEHTLGLSHSFTMGNIH